MLSFLFNFFLYQPRSKSHRFRYYYYFFYGTFLEPGVVGFVQANLLLWTSLTYATQKL